MSQTRANLIFLAVLVLLLAPGAILLVKKKMQPGARQMSMPESVRRQLPFMAPFESGDVVRIVPPVTGQWLEGLAGQRAGRPVFAEGGSPMISDDRVMQLMTWPMNTPPTRAALLFWDETDPAELARVGVTARSGGRVISGRIRSVEPVAVPEGVRKELMQAGYPRPPGKVMWVVVLLDEPVEGPMELSVGRRRVVAAMSP